MSKANESWAEVVVGFPADWEGGIVEAMVHVQGMNYTWLDFNAEEGFIIATVFVDGVRYSMSYENFKKYIEDVFAKVDDTFEVQ